MTLPFLNRIKWNYFKLRYGLHKPTNQALNKLFVGIDKVIITNKEFLEEKTEVEREKLMITDDADIIKLKGLLRIEEKDQRGCCMCAGDYNIELFAGKKIKAKFTLHHGDSIRYHKWDADADLAHVDEFLNFLAQLGLTKPLADYLETKAGNELNAIERNNWFSFAPKSFEIFWERTNNVGSSDIDSLMKDLNTEITLVNEQIIALLRTYGNFDVLRTSCPSYEMLPNEVLKTFETKEIIAAYLNSSRDDHTKRGLGRYLCGFDFKKGRALHLKYIPMEVIDDLEECFDAIGEKYGIDQILSLKNEKHQSL